MTLTLALPSKGRLKDEALALLTRAGYTVRLPDDARTYRAAVEGEPRLEIAFLSASEIARELGAGRIDLGVTGEDLVREDVPDSESRVALLVRLGFGHADVVVAVPQAWFDVDTMADLGEVAAGFRAHHGRRLRIATKYWRLTNRHFSETHGIQLYRIVESHGATEGAPAAGQADLVVDITSTGSTLRANRLKVLAGEDGVVLRSQACLFAARAERSSGDSALIADLAARLEKAAAT